MPLSPAQIAASLAAVLGAAVACALWLRGAPGARRHATRALVACAILATAAWFRFGALHAIAVDVTPATSTARPVKQVRHWPLQFHELFHYYLGAKYFRELGYGGLYDCTALADREIAREEGVAPRISGYVRDLDDVLRDGPVDDAVGGCRATWRGRFTAARWEAFEGDVRALEALVADDAWNDVVYDAGFNPPPSTAVVYSALANLIPIRAGGLPTILLATSLDVGLLAVVVLALRATLGPEAAALAAVVFGTSFFANYGWLGGALLRMLWLAALALSLAAMSRRRWVLAGALLGVAVCDRVFPAAFLAGAALALAASGARRPLVALAAGALLTGAVLVVAGTLAFGVPAWATFAGRTVRYDDVYFVLHVGLRKILTFRGWVPGQDFGGHDGLATFRDWNLRLRATWATMRPLGLALQVAGALLTARAAARRRPEEAALLVGVVSMFLFTLPASYYYVVLCLVPAALLHDAATSPPAGRARSQIALGVFGAFWVLTLLAPPLGADDIVTNFVVCSAFAVVLVVWVAAWSQRLDSPAGA